MSEVTFTDQATDAIDALEDLIRQLEESGLANDAEAMLHHLNVIKSEAPPFEENDDPYLTWRVPVYFDCLARSADEARDIVFTAMESIDDWNEQLDFIDSESPDVGPITATLIANIEEIGWYPKFGTTPGRSS